MLLGTLLDIVHSISTVHTKQTPTGLGPRPVDVPVIFRTHLNPPSFFAVCDNDALVKIGTKRYTHCHCEFSKNGLTFISTFIDQTYRYGYIQRTMDLNAKPPGHVRPLFVLVHEVAKALFRLLQGGFFVLFRLFVFREQVREDEFFVPGLECGYKNVKVRF